jgi:multiple sugar transport system substrate-binding protein
MNRKKVRAMRLRYLKLPVAMAALTAVLLGVAGCGGGSAGEGGDHPTLTFWTLETEPDRVQRTQENLQVFTQRTGIPVDLVTVEEGSLAETMLTNAASGTLPDVVDHPMVMTARWAAAGLLDTQAAQDVITDLGEGTFRKAGLDFARYDGSYAAVPIEGWGNLLYWRKDLFAAAGLAEPHSVQDILHAAQVLNHPENKQYGIVLGTDPSHPVTEQTFESLGLANGCEMIDASGALQFESPACVETFQLYKDLAQYAPAGTFNSSASRASFLSGQAAMMIQAPSLLHRLAGLDDAEPPACEQCTADPAYLAKNTGLVSTITGLHGDSAQYGRTNNLGITVDADTEEAKQLVEYLLSDGYQQWLQQIPNLMIPMRTGTAEDPRKYVDMWKTLDVGVSRPGKLADYWGDGVTDSLVEGAENFTVWGVPEGYGELAGVLYETLAVPEAVGGVLQGATTPAEAAAKVQDRIQSELDVIASGG